MKRRVVFFTLPLIAAFLLVPLACTNNGPAEDTENIQATDQSRYTVPQKAETAQSKAVSSSIKGGKEVKVDQFILVIPGDWKKHRQFDVWCPATEVGSTRPPDHNLTQGARPPTMLNSSDLVEGIKTSIGTDPQDLKMIKIGGMNGATCGWEKGAYRSVGLFIQEKNPMFDIPFLNFFILRAPKDSFHQYKETYEAILKSIRI
ncbi:MAG TPA: hypothetical protein ENN40_00110 [Candidatus Aminicenantes bacterium]|nr:hypothetical protein [Candidatus Aminicenantes bacterium]